MSQQDFDIEATGTLWRLTLWSEHDCHDIWQSCVRLVLDFEKTYSRFRADSLVQMIGPKVGTHTVPRDFTAMLHLYEELYRVTKGQCTPLAGAALSAHGYDATYRFTENSSDLAVPKFQDAITIVDDETIMLHTSVHFDLGALGKGYLADRVMEVLRDAGVVDRALINAGGDLYHYTHSGTKARIGLEDPHDPSIVLGVYELGNSALACSSSSKRRWGTHSEFHHIIDPVTQKHPENVIASWVMHESAAFADGLATSLFLVTPETLFAHYSAEYAILYADGRLAHSEGFQNVFFLT